MKEKLNDLRAKLLECANTATELAEAGVTFNIEIDNGKVMKTLQVKSEGTDSLPLKIRITNATINQAL